MKGGNLNMNYVDTKMQLLSGICRDHRTQCLVVPISRIYYSKRIQSKISPGGSHMGQNPGDTRYKLPRVFSSGVMQDGLIPPATMMTTCLLGKLIRDSVPMVFIGGLSCKHSI